MQKEIATEGTEKDMEVENDKMINGNCWVAYFDFLGFRNLIGQFTESCGQGNLDVFASEYYDSIVRIAESVVDNARKVCSKVNGTIDHCHFSDTFIFFATKDISGQYYHYIAIDMILRHFFIRALLEGFPFKGALSFGDFYADKRKGVFLGPALHDAYDYAEKQDWLGIVLTPKAAGYLKGSELDVDGRIDYAKYGVPVKETDIKDDILQIRRGKENLHAYRISRYPYLEEMIIRKQEETKVQYPEDYEVKYKPKYEDVLRFAQETKLRTVTD